VGPNTLAIVGLPEDAGKPTMQSTVVSQAAATNSRYRMGHQAASMRLGDRKGESSI
jgi:hypothetical protein